MDFKNNKTHIMETGWSVAIKMAALFCLQYGILDVVIIKNVGQTTPRAQCMTPNNSVMLCSLSLCTTYNTELIFPGIFSASFNFYNNLAITRGRHGFSTAKFLCHVSALMSFQACDEDLGKVRPTGC